MTTQKKIEFIALFEPRVSGGITDKFIKSSGYPNSFRVEASGFAGGTTLK